MTRAPDPWAGFSFVVEKDGTQLGGFSQVGGLERETQVEEFREGGVNDFHHQLVTGTKQPNLALKRGLADADLWRWHEDVIGGDISRSTISVIVRTRNGGEALRWVFADAYPVKWSASDLDASSSAVVVESVEFAHRGVTKL